MEIRGITERRYYGHWIKTFPMNCKKISILKQKISKSSIIRHPFFANTRQLADLSGRNPRGRYVKGKQLLRPQFFLEQNSVYQSSVRPRLSAKNTAACCWRTKLSKLVADKGVRWQHFLYNYALNVLPMSGSLRSEMRFCPKTLAVLVGTFCLKSRSKTC